LRKASFFYPKPLLKSVNLVLGKEAFWRAVPGVLYGYLTDWTGIQVETVLEYAGKWLMQSDSLTLSPQKFGAEVHSQETGFPLSRE
jgi:hypothetical protein